MRTRREGGRDRAARMNSDMQQSLQPCDALVAWVDNFNKQRFSANVNEERNRCINGCAIAFIGVLTGPPHAQPAWDGWVPLTVVWDRVPSTASFVNRVSRTFTDAVRALLNLGLTWDTVRIPCDLRRPSVTSAAWWPRAILPHDVGELGPMLECFGYVLHEARGLRKQVAILCDVKPFYSTLKAMYSETHADQNLREALADTPLLL